MPRETTLIAQIEKRERFYDKVDSRQLMFLIVGLVLAIICNSITSYAITLLFGISTSSDVNQAATGNIFGLLLKGATLLMWIGYFGWKVYSNCFKNDSKYGKLNYQRKIIQHVYNKKQRIFLYQKKGITIIDKEFDTKMLDEIEEDELEFEDEVKE